MDRKKLVILTPTNRADKMSDLVDSIEKLSNIYDDYIWLVGINNASTEETNKIVDLINKVKNVAYITNLSGSLGYVRSYLATVAIKYGEWATWIDSDDSIGSVDSLVSIMMRVANNADNSYAMILPTSYESDGVLCDYQSNENHEEPFNAYINHDRYQYIWGLIYNSEYLSKRFCFSDCSVFEDVLFMYNILKDLNSDNKYIKLNTSWYKRTHNNDSASSVLTTATLEGLAICYEDLCEIDREFATSKLKNLSEYIMRKMR